MNKLILSIFLLFSLISFSQNDGLVYNPNLEQSFIEDNTITGEAARILLELKECCDCSVYRPQTRDANQRIRILKKQLKDCQTEKLKKIGIPIVIIVVIILIVLFFFNNEKNKKNPLKNLDNLKKNNIITQEEYEEKINNSKNNTQKKLNKKLISEVENLRDKGILTEEESRRKIKKIKKRTI
jgi:hypothetical protein